MWIPIEIDFAHDYSQNSGKCGSILTFVWNCFGLLVGNLLNFLNFQAFKYSWEFSSYSLEYDKKYQKRCNFIFLSLFNKINGGIQC